MQVEQWATKAVLLLAILTTACSKHEENATAKQPEMPVSDASASANVQEKFYDSEDLLEAALTMARDLTFLTDLQGKFAGYGSIDALAKRTDAQRNVHWKAFAGMVSGTMQGPYGYRTPLGDFVMVSATTPDQKQIGLVVNLGNQKTALYPVGSREIRPAGDNLASALVVALEVENKIKSSVGNGDYTTAALRARTIAALEQAIGDGGSAKIATGTRGEREAQPNATGNAGAYAEAIAAQKAAIGKDSAEQESKSLGQARANAMETHLLELLYAVFDDAKKSGLKLNDPRAHINSVNKGRRNSGVWELTVEQYGPDPRFVVIRDFGNRSGMFSVESVGPMSANAYIRDSDFEATGKFSEDCIYEIVAGNRSVKYRCMAFLEGKHDRELVVALRDMVIAEVKDASSRSTQ